jgi:hypothetical protein
VRPPFVDAKRKRTGSSGNPNFNPLQPRGGDGRWITTAGKVERLKALAGQNTILHLPIADVRSPAAASAVAGINVRGFKHAISNQFVAKLRKDHPDIGADDFLRIPAVLKSGVPRLAPRGGPNGVPRLLYRARIEGQLYEYVGEVRAGKRRIDGITFYRVI